MIQEEIYKTQLTIKTIESILTEDKVNAFYHLDSSPTESPNTLTTSEKCWLLFQCFTQSQNAKRYSGFTTVLDEINEKSINDLMFQVKIGNLDFIDHNNATDIVRRMIYSLEGNEMRLHQFLEDANITEKELNDMKYALENHTGFPISADLNFKLCYFALLAQMENTHNEIGCSEWHENEDIAELKTTKLVYSFFIREYNLLCQEIPFVNMFVLSDSNYVAIDEYHNRITDILYSFSIYRLVYDDFEGNFLECYVKNIFEGPGQKTAFIKFVSGLGGKYMQYAILFWAILKKHYEMKRLPLPIDLSGIIDNSAIEEINEEEAREKRCTVAAEYACRYHYIQEEKKEMFLRIVNGRSSENMNFGHGISKNTKKPKQTGGVRVLFILIQYIQNPASLKEKKWITKDHAKSLFTQLGMGDKDLQDTGYKQKNVEDITGGLIEYEKFIMEGDSTLENMLRQ